MRELPHVELYLSQALALMGVPYIWCGKGEHGLDCSGHATFALKLAGGPDWTQTHDTERLFCELPEVSRLELAPGHLVFWHHGTPKPGDQVDHVETFLAYRLTFGASGGGRDCTSRLIAAQKNAKVKLGRLERKGARLMGFRALPLDYGGTR